MMIRSPRYAGLPIELVDQLKGIEAGDDTIHEMYTRLVFIDELAEKLQDWGEVISRSEEDLDCIDRVQLHSALSLSLAKDGCYSWWIAHSSWTADFDAEISEENVSCNAALAASLMEGDKKEFVRGLAEASKAIRERIDAIFCAGDFSVALGVLIRLDAVIAIVLAASTHRRLFAICSRKKGDSGD